MRPSRRPRERRIRPIPELDSGPRGVLPPAGHRTYGSHRPPSDSHLGQRHTRMQEIRSSTEDVMRVGQVWLVLVAAGLGVSALFAPAGAESAKASGSSQWSMNATAIEACSCPMFCQCYFNSEPAGHGEHGDHAGSEHFCKFNNAYKVN